MIYILHNSHGYKKSFLYSAGIRSKSSQIYGLRQFACVLRGMGAEMMMTENIFFLNSPPLLTRRV